MTKQKALLRIGEILNRYCDDPIAEMMKEGTAMLEIAKALEGQSLQEARAIIKAAAELV
jgi:hypothetical protein